MRLTSDDLQALYREQTARAARPASDCPAAETLWQAAAGEMPQSERQRLADHLSACADCAGEYRMIRSLQQPAPPPRPSEAGRRWFWGLLTPARLSWAVTAALMAVSLGYQVVQLRREAQQVAALRDEALAGQARDAAAARESVAEAERRLDETARRSEGYAAEIAELRKRNAELSRSVDDLSRPQANMDIIDLDPRDSRRGDGQGAAQLVEGRRGARGFAVNLNVAGQPSFADYAVEIRGAGGKVIWRERGLRMSDGNIFTFTVTRRALPAGQYRVRLFGLDGKRQVLVEDYAIKIRYK